MLKSILKKLVGRGNTEVRYAGMGADLSPEEWARRAAAADDVSATLDSCFFTIQSLAKGFTTNDVQTLSRLNAALASTSAALQDSYPGLMKSPHRSPAASYVEAFASSDWTTVNAYAGEIFGLVRTCPQDPPSIRQNVIIFILSPMNIPPHVRPTGGLFGSYSQG